MLVTIGELRKAIKYALTEAGGAAPTKHMFNYIGNAMSPDTSDREQLGYLTNVDVDIDPDIDLPTHLRNSTEEPEDCWGPVPPVQGDPYVQQDPLTRDISPLPTPPIKR